MVLTLTHLRESNNKLKAFTGDNLKMAKTADLFLIE